MSDDEAIIDSDGWELEDYIELFNIDSSIEASEIDAFVADKKNILKTKVDESQTLTSEEKTTYKDFLDDAETEVITKKNEIIEDLDEKQEDVEELLQDTDEETDDTLNMKVNLAGGEKMAQIRQDINIPKSYSEVPFVQGERNPTLQNTYTTWLNIDSTYRNTQRKTSTSVSLCPEKNIEEKEEINQRDITSDFILTLDSPITNILEMCLVNIEIDLENYKVFADTYGNKTFEIDNGKIYDISINSGNYNKQELEDEINRNIENQNDLSGIKIKLTDNTNKAFLYGEPSKIPWVDAGVKNKNEISALKNFSTVIDKNNIIYLIGGVNNDGEPQDSIYFLDLNFKNLGWMKLNYTLNTARSCFKSTITNQGILYVIGGKGKNNYLSSVESFNLNILNNWWIENKNNNTFTNYLTEETIHIHSDVYNDLSNNIQGKFDNLTNIMLKKERSDFALVKTDDDVVYVLGGEQTQNSLVSVLNDIEVIDFKNINSNFEASRFHLTAKRRGHEAIIINNEIYVIGGEDKTTYNKKIVKFNLQDSLPSEEELSIQLTTGRSYFGLYYNSKNRIYIFGGKTLEGITSGGEVIDFSPESGQENIKSINSTFHSGRSHFGYIKDSDENFYAIGGISSGSINYTVEKFKSITEIIWYDDKKDYYCNNDNKGKRVNSSLGWCLGFRELRSIFKKNIYNGDFGIKGTKSINLKGTPYLFLEVDDYNKNRYTGKVMTMSTSSELDNFKTPEYAKKIETSFSICKTRKKNLIFKEKINFSKGLINNETIKRQNRVGTQPSIEAVIGRDTLTNAQKYTMLQIKNHQTRPKINQYYSPYSDNILYRFPVRNEFIGEGTQIVLNEIGMEYGRKYFGPVTIEKLRIRLLDNKGFPIDLQDGEISLSLILTRLYQY